MSATPETALATTTTARPGDPLSRPPQINPETGVLACTMDRPDSNGGDVSLDITIDAPPEGMNVVGLTARGSALTLGDGRSDYYAAWLDLATGRLGVSLWRGTSERILASVRLSSPPAGAPVLKFSLCGSALSVALHDGKTGRWVARDGTWGTFMEAALTVTNGDLSGPGYGGYYARRTVG